MSDANRQNQEAEKRKPEPNQPVEDGLSFVKPGISFAAVVAGNNTVAATNVRGGHGTSAAAATSDLCNLPSRSDNSGHEGRFLGGHPGHETPVDRPYHSFNNWCAARQAAFEDQQDYILNIIEELRGVDFPNPIYNNREAENEESIQLAFKAAGLD